MTELELTWIRTIKIWWGLVWRMMVYSILLGLLISFPVGILSAAFSFDQPTIDMLAQGIAAAISLLLGIWILRVVLTKNYSDFRIVLVPSDEVLLKQELSETGDDQ